MLRNSYADAVGTMGAVSYNALMSWYIIAFLAASVFFGIVILVVIVGLIRKAEADKRKHDETTSPN